MADLKSFILTWLLSSTVVLAREESSENSKSDAWCWKDIVLPISVRVAAVASAPIVLSAAGFGAGGIVAGSLAATVQSAGLAGPLFGALQSAGMAGLGYGATAATFSAGAIVGKKVADQYPCDQSVDETCDKN